MESSIFPVFYSFYRTYTKISIIFGSAHDLLYQIKHTLNFAQKEKGEVTVQRAAQELAWSLTGGSRPSVPSSSSRHGSSELKHAIGELSAFAVGRASFPSTTRTHCHPFWMLSHPLTPTAVSMADSDLGHATAGCYKRKEHKPRGTQAPAAHRDFEELLCGVSEGWRRAGHGKCSRRRFRPESEENGSVAGYEGLELVLGSANGCWVLGGVVGAPGWLGKGARKANLVGGVSSSASGSFSTAARGFILATQCLLRMRTPGRRPASKQLRGQARGGAGRSSSAPAAVHPPCSSTVASHIPFILLFCKIRPKFELKSEIC